MSERLARIEPDWADVERRSARLRSRSLRRKGALAATVVATVLVAGAPALGVRDWLRDLVRGTPISTQRLTAWDVHGFAALADRTHPVPLDRLRTPVERRRALVRSGLTGVRLIGSRAGLDFYVLDLRGGRDCYATGGGGRGRLFSSVTCPSGSAFPSPTLPVMDESVTSEQSHVLRLAGLAATGVAAVGVAAPDGTVRAKTRVRDNVFVNEHVPAAARGPLVAYDASGRVIWCSGANPACGRVPTAAGGGRVVRLYLDDGASSTDIGEAIAAARTEPRVAGVRFVSKQAALALMKKKFPQLFRTRLPSNPFPNAIEVRVARDGDAAAIASDLRAKKLPGVRRVGYGR